MSFAHNTVICTHHFLYLAILSYFIFILLWLLLMSPCSTCLHIPPPPRTVMLILIFNSTAYCHAHSLILYILYSVLYILFFIHFILCILPLLYSTIFALSMERTWFTFHCWLYNLCIVVYVTNKTWNLNLKLGCKRTEQIKNVMAWQTKCSIFYHTLSVLCGAFGKSCCVIHLNTLLP